MIFQNGIKFLLKRFLRRRTRSKDIFAYYWTRFFPRKNKKTIKKFHSYNFTCYIVVRVNNIFVLKKKKIKKIYRSNPRSLTFSNFANNFYNRRERKRGDNLFYTRSVYFCEKRRKVLQLFFKLEIDFWNIYFLTRARKRFVGENIVVPEALSNNQEI